jgi:hypothetical protein
MLGLPCKFVSANIGGRQARKLPTRRGALEDRAEAAGRAEFGARDHSSAHVDALSAVTMAERGRDDRFAPSAAPLAGEAIWGLVGREDLDRARGTQVSQSNGAVSSSAPCCARSAASVAATASAATLADRASPKSPLAT